MTPTSAKPMAQGLYKTAVRYGDMIQTSGMTPRDGDTMLHVGIIQEDDDPQQHADAVRIATKNAVTAMQSCLEPGEKVSLVTHLVTYIATEPGFTKHAKIADHASQFLRDIFGENCIGTRAAIGVASLPSNAPVEITLTVLVERS